MTVGRVWVREKATSQTIEVWPIDASELLASKQYEPADEPTVAIAAGKPAFPMTGKARPTVERVTTATEPASAGQVEAEKAPKGTLTAGKKKSGKKSS